MNQTIIRGSFLLFLLAPIGIIQSQSQKGVLVKGKLVSLEISKKTNLYF